MHRKTCRINKCWVTEKIIKVSQDKSWTLQKEKILKWSHWVSFECRLVVITMENKMRKILLKQWQCKSTMNHMYIHIFILTHFQIIKMQQNMHFICLDRSHDHPPDFHPPNAFSHSSYSHVAFLSFSIKCLKSSLYLSSLYPQLYSLLTPCLHPSIILKLVLGSSMPS